ncbi:MAG: hypothetical protein P8177_15045 [Gemmatimonadota bacterium]
MIRPADSSWTMSMGGSTEVQSVSTGWSVVSKRDTGMRGRPPASPSSSFPPRDIWGLPPGPRPKLNSGRNIRMNPPSSAAISWDGMPAFSGNGTVRGSPPSWG